jgi:hypothetical protein
MLDARASGHKAVRITIDGDRVRVLPASTTQGASHVNATA